MSPFPWTWLIGLGAAVAWMLAAWALSLWRRDASVVDGFWGAGACGGSALALAAMARIATAEFRNSRIVFSAVMCPLLDGSSG